MLEFVWPWMFWLLPLPLLMLLIPSSGEQQAALRVPYFQRLQAFEGVSIEGKPHFSWLSLLVLMLVWACLVSAAARPKWIGDPIELPTTGRDLMLAVDISGSMKVEDMVIDKRSVNRVIAVKYVVNRFLDERRGDKIGLILFGTQAYVQAPLTYDVDTIQQLLAEAQIGFAGEKTAIGDAIGLALKRLQQRASDSRVLILLSDGADTASQVKPMQAAKLAAQEDMRIYTVGIGADEMIQRSLFGNRRVNPSLDLDEELLKNIANTTGGNYYRARNVEDLEKIYAEINALEPIEQEGESFRPEQSLLHYPLATALALLTLLALAQANIWRRA